MQKVTELVPRPIKVSGEEAALFHPSELLALSMAVYDAHYFDKLSEITINKLNLVVWSVCGDLYFKDDDGNTVFMKWTHGNTRELQTYPLLAMANALLRYFYHGEVPRRKIIDKRPLEKKVRPMKSTYTRLNGRFPKGCTPEQKKELFFKIMQEKYGSDPTRCQCPECGSYFIKSRLQDHMSNVHYKRKVGVD